jgi:hypothetical protein
VQTNPEASTGFAAGARMTCDQHRATPSNARASLATQHIYFCLSDVQLLHMRVLTQMVGRPASIIVFSTRRTDSGSRADCACSKRAETDTSHHHVDHDVRRAVGACCPLSALQAQDEWALLLQCAYASAVLCHQMRAGLSAMRGAEHFKITPQAHRVYKSMAARQTAKLQVSRMAQSAAATEFFNLQWARPAAGRRA